MTESQEKLLLKAQMLHELIEKHPYLSAIMTDTCHSYLDELIVNGMTIRSEFPKERLRAPIDQLILEKYEDEL